MMATVKVPAGSWPRADALAAVRLAEVGSDGFYRSWVQMLPEGEFDHPKFGKIDLSAEVLRELKEHFDDGVRGIEIALDYDHKASEGDSAAPGWLERVELRPPHGVIPAGLWGQVRWTKIGLRDVKDQIYRYLSAEFKPDYTDEMSGKKYKNVLIGLTLTNRPFMKNMPAIALAESSGNTSSRAWGSVDKSKLPDACFLDPKNRRLPIYEGAGAIGADGKYTKRGKLNLKGLEAALAAVHGAHTGKAMSGLPSGVVARIERLAAAHGIGQDGKGSDNKGGSTAASSEAGWGRGGDGMGKVMLEDLEDALAFASKKGSGDEDSEDFDSSSDTHGAMTCAEHSHGKYGPHSHDGDANHSDAPLKTDADGDDDGDTYAEDGVDDAETYDDAEPARDGEEPVRASGRGGRKMSESGAALTLAEYQVKMREMEAQLVELRRDKYQAQVDKWLTGWDAGTFQFTESRVKNPDAEGAKTKQSKAVRVALSRPARQAVEAFLLSERAFTMAEDERGELLKLFEVIAAGTVDLSVRGSSRDTEETEQQQPLVKVEQARRKGIPADEALQMAAERVATERGLHFSELRQKSAAGNHDAYEALWGKGGVYAAAEKLIGYEGVR